MFKNFVIVILVFLLCSLLFQNKQNVDILVENMADTTERVVDGSVYLKKTFDDKFGPKEFDVEDTLDIPSLQIEKEPMIREETFFDEK